MNDELPAGVPSEQADAARETLGGAVVVSESLPDALGTQLVDVAQEAFTLGLQVSALVSAVIAAVSAVIAAVLLRNVRMGTEQEYSPGSERAPTAVPVTDLE